MASSIVFGRLTCSPQSRIFLGYMMKHAARASVAVDPIRFFASDVAATRKDHVVIALGGNALLKRGEKMTVENQRKNIAEGMASLKNIVRDHKATIVHGNGPQVGLLVLQVSEYQKQTGLEPMKLDVLDAETEGMIGYMIEQELQSHIGPDRGMATVLSQIVVDENDPAFQNPTKFIGPIYTKEEVEKLGLAPVKQDGDHFRKVVPSPLPVKMIDQQMRAVELLTNNDCVVICAGGGGIPVIEDRKTGQLRGIEAVIDKDRAATMVAKKLNAKGLIILTDVEAVATGFGSPEQKWIKSVSPEILKTMMNDFPPGSMGPKVESAIDFVEQNPGGWCAIGSLKDGDKILSHQAGTIVTTAYGPYHLEFYGATHEDPAEAA